MGIIFASSSMDVLGIVVAVIAVAAGYISWKYKYWERRNLKFLKPTFPFGSVYNPLNRKRHLSIQLKQYYDELKPLGYKHAGMFIFTAPVYVPFDLDIIKGIMSKDFQHFGHRGIYYNERDDPISAHLFSIGGVKWKNLRAKLTPTFTSGKMKMMFETIVAAGDQLKEAMDRFCSKNEPVDIKDVFGCFTTDVIGSCAFGIDCNTFLNPNSEFRKYGKKAFNKTSFESAKILFTFVRPDMARFLGVVNTSPEVSQFFMSIVQQTVEYREKNNVIRNDFLQILINLKHNLKNEEGDGEASSYKHDGKTLSMEEVVAQAFVFFLAGFETSATTVTFCLYELACHPNIQQKVRDEVNAVLAKHGGKLTYEAVMEMKYMGQVIDETLRKYPPVPVLNRECTQTYKVPDCDLIIENGTSVLIPVLALQRDPEYYPEPDKFDPSRFAEENKMNIPHFTYMPFGEGPRICIGLRFGLLQSKVGLAILLQRFVFSLNSKTEVPLRMDPYSFVLSSVGGVWLDVRKVGEK